MPGGGYCLMHAENGTAATSPPTLVFGFGLLACDLGGGRRHVQRAGLGVKGLSKASGSGGKDKPVFGFNKRTGKRRLVGGGVGHEQLTNNWTTGVPAFDKRTPVADPQLSLMDPKSHARSCPACGHHFIPWQTWRISRWSCIACPHCGVRLNRRFDAQMLLMFMLMCFLGAVLVFLAIHGLPFSVGVALTVAAMFMIWLADIMTIRLVVAGKWRRFFGYET
jgi:hypothetical protein